MDIKIKVTKEGFDEHFSIEDWLNFREIPNVEMYNKMLMFVVDENDQPVPETEARKMFKTVKKSEWSEYVIKFMQAVNDAYVSPTSGGS